MTDIVERLRFDAVRCELQFSKGIAENIGEAADEIVRLREDLEMAKAAIMHRNQEIEQLNARFDDVPSDHG